MEASRIKNSRVLPAEIQKEEFAIHVTPTIHVRVNIHFNTLLSTVEAQTTAALRLVIDRPSKQR